MTVPVAGHHGVRILTISAAFLLCPLLLQKPALVAPELARNLPNARLQAFELLIRPSVVVCQSLFVRVTHDLIVVRLLGDKLFLLHQI